MPSDAPSDRPSAPPPDRPGEAQRDLRLDLVAELVGGSGGLCTVGVTRADGSVHATVVNAGLLAHPVSGRPVVGFVARSGARKVAHLRARPRAAVTFRVDWRWATVEGDATLVGPDDPHPEVDADRLRRLLREVYQACGGTHDDFDEFDRVMARERRLAVLVEPVRTLVNRPA
jgi:PPOX class probable F420-dependent enzyme